MKFLFGHFYVFVLLCVFYLFYYLFFDDNVLSFFDILI